MKNTREVLEHDMGSIRAGHANASLLTDVKVDYYGAPTPLNQIASISIPEARVILITPYDKSSLKDIEKQFTRQILALAQLMQELPFVWPFLH